MNLTFIFLSVVLVLISQSLGFKKFFNKKLSHKKFNNKFHKKEDPAPVATGTEVVKDQATLQKEAFTGLIGGFQKPFLDKEVPKSCN